MSRTFALSRSTRRDCWVVVFCCWHFPSLRPWDQSTTSYSLELKKKPQHLSLLSFYWKPQEPYWAMMGVFCFEKSIADIFTDFEIVGPLQLSPRMRLDSEIKPETTILPKNVHIAMFFLTHQISLNVSKINLTFGVWHHTFIFGDDRAYLMYFWKN